jgi:hypothetical protein
MIKGFIIKPLEIKWPDLEMIAIAMVSYTMIAIAMVSYTI